MTYTVEYQAGTYSGRKTVNASDEDEALAKVRAWVRRQMISPMYSEKYQVVGGEGHSYTRLGEGRTTMGEIDPNLPAGIVEGAARAMFVDAWAGAWERAVEDDQAESLPWGGGEDLTQVAPETPPDFVKDAETFVRTTAFDNKVDLAKMAEEHEIDEHTFGFYLAMEGMGHGVGLWEYIEDHGLKIPHIEPILDYEDVKNLEGLGATGDKPKKYRPSKLRKHLKVRRIVPAAGPGAQRVEFEDDISIHVHSGHGRNDVLYAMKPADMRHEGRQPGPESRRDYQHAALTAVLGDRNASFVIDRDGDVRANLSGLDDVNDSAEAEELVIFATTSSEPIYKKLRQAAYALGKRLYQGTYVEEKALVLMKHIADAAAKQYAREYGGSWNSMFSPKVRAAAAARLLHEWVLPHIDVDIKRDLEAKYGQKRKSRLGSANIPGMEPNWRIINKNQAVWVAPSGREYHLERSRRGGWEIAMFELNAPSGDRLKVSMIPQHLHRKMVPRLSSNDYALFVHAFDAGEASAEYEKGRR